MKKRHWTMNQYCYRLRVRHSVDQGVWRGLNVQVSIRQMILRGQTHQREVAQEVRAEPICNSDCLARSNLCLARVLLAGRDSAVSQTPIKTENNFQVSFCYVFNQSMPVLSISPNQSKFSQTVLLLQILDS